MTAENDGTGAGSTQPQGDDPFGYLYRQEGGEASPAPQGGGVPRRSYNQVRAVGERQYGGYGGGPGTQQTAAYGQQPNAYYAAPETMPGGRTGTQRPVDDGYGHGGHGGGHGGGGSRNGLLVGALAVVAAVVIGISAAIYFNQGGEEGQNGGAAAPGDGGKGQQQKPDKPRKGQQIGKKQDAAAFQLAGGAAAQSDVPGAKGSGGSYVGAMNATGASATWSSPKVPEAGVYTLYVRFGIPGKDADATLSVNGQPRSLNMENFNGVKEGDWENGWMRTYSWVELKQGTNDFKISCEDGNKCEFNLDQVWLKAGKIR